MNSFFTQVSSSIRILGWNRDASARATHLKAAGGNVPSATIERKSMSTKTSIKRIALVAAAALTLGGFSAVSASAADNTYMFPKSGDGASFSSVTGAGATLNGVAGPANSVTIGFTNNSQGIATISGGTFGAVSGTNLTLNTAGTLVTTANNVTNGDVTVLTPTVGTITVNFYKYVSAGVYASTATESVVITVAAAASSGVFSAAKSTIYMAAGETSVASATTDASAVLVASTIKTETAVATVAVTLLDSLGARYKDTVTATIISGPGTLFGSNESRTALVTPAYVGAPGVETTTATRFYSNPAAPAYSVTVSGLANDGEIRSMYFGIFANGQSGVSTIQFKNSAGTVLGTKSVTFYSLTPSTVKVTVLKKNVLNSSTSATNAVFAVNVYDSGANEITGTQTITAAVATGSTVGGTVTCATTQDATALAYLCSAQSNAAQALLTTDASETYTFTAGTATTTAAVKFVSGVIGSVTVAGPASADPGTKVAYKLTATGANGAALPDGDYAPGAIFTNADPVTNAQLVAIPFGKGETITLVNGVATDYTYAPFSGTLSASWTLRGSATAAAATSASFEGADSYYTAAGIAKGAGASIIAADDVAITANTEATAAANAATDAANQAADAADNATQAAAEALAAVNTLATTVATLIDGIKSQIKALNTLILAIKKKIKA